MHERGKIRNREFATQIRDFSGLRYGKITPTDIDGFLDFGNKLFVFIESKYGTGRLPYGQRLALERLCDACHCPPLRVSILLIGRHLEKDNVDYANMRVVEYRWRKKWCDAEKEKTIGEVISMMIERYT